MTQRILWSLTVIGAMALSGTMASESEARGCHHGYYGGYPGGYYPARRSVRYYPSYYQGPSVYSRRSYSTHPRYYGGYGGYGGYGSGVSLSIGW